MTVTGLQLAGLKNMYTANEENVEQIMQENCEDADVILITESLSQEAERTIDRLRREEKIVVEIPDRESGSQQSINEIVKEVVGFELAK